MRSGLTDVRMPTAVALRGRGGVFHFLDQCCHVSTLPLRVDQADCLFFLFVICAVVPGKKEVFHGGSFRVWEETVICIIHSVFFIMRAAGNIRIFVSITVSICAIAALLIVSGRKVKENKEMQTNRYEQKSVLGAAKLLRNVFMAVALCLPMKSVGDTPAEAPARKVICMGETVLDILFRGDRPIGANAGGSALNAAVSMARAGLNVVFIGEAGADTTGAHIRAFLEANQVDTHHLRLRPGMKTTVSTAYLDEANNARYTFYPDPQLGDREFTLPDIRR